MASLLRWQDIPPLPSRPSGSGGVVRIAAEQVVHDASSQAWRGDYLRPRAHVRQRGRGDVILCHDRVHRRLRGDVVLCSGMLRQRHSCHINNVLFSNTSLLFAQTQGRRASAPVTWGGGRPVHVYKRPWHRTLLDCGHSSPAPRSGDVQQQWRTARTTARLR